MAAAEEASSKKIVIVGGGLVGSLCAIFLVKRGFKVDLYEAREDPRSLEFVRGRSTNLALSTRGIEALTQAGVLESILPLGVAKFGRMLHSISGVRTPLYYDQEGPYPLLAMERRKVNEKLLSAVETFSNVKLYFEHKLLSADLEKGHLTFSRSDGKTVEVDAQLIIGADGARSSIRNEMMRRPRFDYSQEYIPHGYKEFQLLPTQSGEYAIEENYLHVWPRDSFMLIAIPNKEQSFTCTLIMAFENFDALETKEDIMSFFNATFPDFVQVMGEERILEDFFKNPVLPMVSIKCKPYHVTDKALIIGDAAHAMVPFFAQGMNSVATDSCLSLHRRALMHTGTLETMKEDFELLEAQLRAMEQFRYIKIQPKTIDFGAVLEEYSRTRNKDAEAICDLSMYNYLEMRSLVNSLSFLLERKILSVLHWLMPKTFIPLHTMVTFTQIPYQEVVERSQWQEKTVRNLLVTGTLSGLAGLLLLFRIFRSRLS